MYLKRPVGWWIGPPNRLACGAKYAAKGGMALLLLLGLLANLTVIGSVEPFGMVPFSSWMARSASMRWSNLMNPTPFDRPARTTGVIWPCQGLERHLPWLSDSPPQVSSFNWACACFTTNILLPWLWTPGGGSGPAFIGHIVLRKSRGTHAPTRRWGRLSN
jgi:hypothetical protein